MNFWSDIAAKDLTALIQYIILYRYSILQDWHKEHFIGLVGKFKISLIILRRIFTHMVKKNKKNMDIGKLRGMHLLIILVLLYYL